MARYYGPRPENALKEANGLIQVSRNERALDALLKIFNKKWNKNWDESVLEPIYRNRFQVVNVISVENAFMYYLRLTNEKTEAARKQSQQALIDIDDLDNMATPESILLSAVSGNDDKSRSDRAVLTPWVRFLWESYCLCIELLKTNAHLEILYHTIVRMTFAFCLEYEHKTEFLRLCTKLRKHLEYSTVPQMSSNISINKLETQKLNRETRMTQFEAAFQMELYQEAYKTIEDIHGLMNISKKLTFPKTMANYYQKLLIVFWKTGNHVFHARALLKLFNLSRDMKKNMSSEELQEMADRVILAILSIPLPSVHSELDCFIETDKSPQEKMQKLAALLGFLQPPSRASLLKDIDRLNVLSLASRPIQDLYNWLEVEFQPLELCSNVESVVSQLRQDESSPLLQYIPALQDLTLVRFVHQISQVYQTIQSTRLIELAKFTDVFHLERLLVDCVRYNDVQIRIDHGKKSIHFGVDLSEAQSEDHPDGPVLQAMPSEQIRCQLVNMATVFHRANNITNPNKKKQECEELRARMVRYYHDTRAEEHRRILGRHKIIEERKEYTSSICTTCASKRKSAAKRRFNVNNDWPN
ncbi:hypothetical protein TKK_0018580 [Trichogramma kaykai]|uniref:PCI domain-containing protein n=1 Tax=Trichogramma kaykai TaxID=54128 RepID=A0ABD2VYU4_9HYME